MRLVRIVNIDWSQLSYPIGCLSGRETMEFNRITVSKLEGVCYGDTSNEAENA